jgi:hypothetical protein
VRREPDPLAAALAEPRSFGDLLRSHRLAAGLTQEALALPPAARAAVRRGLIQTGPDWSCPAVNRTRRVTLPAETNGAGRPTRTLQAPEPGDPIQA